MGADGPGSGWGHTLVARGFKGQVGGWEYHQHGGEALIGPLEARPLQALLRTVEPSPSPPNGNPRYALSLTQTGLQFPRTFSPLCNCLVTGPPCRSKSF